jgi:hypothetical protein
VCQNPTRLRFLLERDLVFANVTVDFGQELDDTDMQPFDRDYHENRDRQLEQREHLVGQRQEREDEKREWYSLSSSRLGYAGADSL